MRKCALLILALADFLHIFSTEAVYADDYKRLQDAAKRFGESVLRSLAGQIFGPIPVCAVANAEAARLFQQVTLAQQVYGHCGVRNFGGARDMRSVSPDTLPNPTKCRAALNLTCRIYRQVC